MYNKEFRDTFINPRGFGRLFIISGISGSGKSYVLNLLKEKLNFMSIKKIVTRPFRKQEIQDLLNNEDIDVKPVYGLYNDGDQSAEVQEANKHIRLQKFLSLKLPFAYLNNNGEYYGFDVNEINACLQNGKNVAIIVNDISYITDLKRIYGKTCVTVFVHRQSEISLNDFLKIAEARGDTEINANIRYNKAVRDQQVASMNVFLYDIILLNTQENNPERLLDAIKKSYKPKKEKMLIDAEWKPVLYVFMGTPGSGKDALLNLIKVQGTLHSVVIPKYTTRERRNEDGTELFCQGEYKEDFWTNLDPKRYISYKNYNNNYAIDCEMIRQRLADGVPCSIIVSNKEAIENLQQQFPDRVVTIYMSGLSKSEYKQVHANELDEDYIKIRIEKYDEADKLYAEGFFDHVIIYYKSPDMIKHQLYIIMAKYELGRPLTNIEQYITYMAKATRYANLENYLDNGGNKFMEEYE